MADTMRSFFPALKGKRHLDIGCGYGGTCIAFASEGALSTGIDQNGDLLRLAISNSVDHPDLNVGFMQLDIMDANTLETLGRFDIITCDNVIEHVEIPERLIAHLRRLINPNGFVYLTIPNAFSIGQIRKDCHYSQFGLSLLDPLDAAEYVKHSIGQSTYDVSEYFSYGYYEDQFRKYGFAPRLLNSIQPSESQMKEISEQFDELIRAWEDARSTLDIPGAITLKIDHSINQHRRRLEADLAFYDQLKSNRQKWLFSHRLIRDYEIELWYVVLKPMPYKIKDYVSILSNRIKRFYKKVLGS